MLGKVASAIGSAGGTIGSVDLIKVEGRHTIRDITVETADDSVWPQLTDAVNAIAGARVLDSTDLTFHVHLGGKIEVANKRPLKTHDDLSMAYTPGVARVCNAIRHDPEQAFALHDQAQHRGGRVRRHRRARPRRHRAEGGDAGDGGQGDAVQGVRRRRRIPDLPGHEGSRRDRVRRQGDRAGLRRDQPRGHLRPALLRDRGSPARGARHPGVPRRPARHRGRGAGGAVQRAEAHRRAASRT